MTAPAATRPHAAAIIATLTGAGLVADDSQASGDSTPRTVVYVSPGLHDGTLGDRFKDVTVAFQTTSIGSTPEQALWQHDRTVAALLGATPTVAGRVSHPIYMDEAPEPVRRDDIEAAALFYAVARWQFHTTA